MPRGAGSQQTAKLTISKSTQKENFSELADASRHAIQLSHGSARLSKVVQIVDKLNTLVLTGARGQ